MKNLKEIAASIYNLYQFADIPERYLTRYKSDGYLPGNYDGNSLPEFLKTLKGYEIGIFYEAKQDTNYTGITNYYIDHSHILIKKEDSDNVMMLRQDRNKKYYFYPYYGLMHHYQNIDYHIKDKSLKELPEPNKIGVFTEKKVNDWFVYNEKYLAILENVLAEVNGKNAEHEKTIKDFIASIPGCKVSAHDNKTWVTTKLFEVIFQHNKAEKYLSTQVTFRGSINDITKIETAK